MVQIGESQFVKKSSFKDSKAFFLAMFLCHSLLSIVCLQKIIIHTNFLSASKY